MFEVLLFAMRSILASEVKHAPYIYCHAVRETEACASKLTFSSPKELAFPPFHPFCPLWWHAGDNWLCRSMLPDV